MKYKNWEKSYFRRIMLNVLSSPSKFIEDEFSSCRGRNNY